MSPESQAPLLRRELSYRAAMMRSGGQVGETLGLDEARAFVANQQWTYARTMPKWPHEYIVKDRIDAPDRFEAMCRLIRAAGEVEPWPPPPAAPIYRNRYLVLDTSKYWAMGGDGDRGPIERLTVINRTSIKGDCA